MEKLEGVKLHGSKLVAACPACREQGADKSADHLVIYSDGRFGCVVHPKDELHRRRIWWLVGDRDALPDAEVDALDIRSKGCGQIKVVKRVSFRARAASMDRTEQDQAGTDATAHFRLAERTVAPTCPLSHGESIVGTGGTAKSDIAEYSKVQVKGTKGSISKKSPANPKAAVGGVPNAESLPNEKPTVPSHEDSIVGTHGTAKSDIAEYSEVQVEGTKGSSSKGSPTNPEAAVVGVPNAGNLPNGKASVPSVPDFESLFKRTSPASGVPTPVVTRSRDDLGWIAADLINTTRIALDVETYGEQKGDALDPWKGDIRLLNLRGDAGGIWLIDLREVGYDLGQLQAVLEAKTIIAHNAKFDMAWLRVKCGLRCRSIFCTMTASRLLTAGMRPGNKLDDCLERHLKVPPGPDQSRSDWGSILLTEEQITYASRDIDHLHALADVLETEIRKHDLRKVWELERALLPHVVDMETAGFAVDEDRLASIRDTSRADADTSCEVLREALGKPDLNPASPQQLLAALREKGVMLDSTKEEVLKANDDGQFIPMILAFRAAQKRAQQAVSLLDHVQPDGRIHAHFEPTGTATGRFSSKEPNLQNVGRGELRKAFIAPPGRSLVVADYSQIELRAAAAIAGEGRMIEAYKAGKDLHSVTASTVLGKAEDEVTKEDRQTAKSANFGLLFGQAAPGLMRYAATSFGVHLSKERAQEIRGTFFRTYSKLFQWHTRSKQEANFGAKEVRTRLGRRRLIPGTASSWERFTALVNMPVQGGTADGMKQAIVLVAQRICDDAHLVATVHDELVIECHEEDAEGVKKIVTDSMTETMANLFPEVPIEVEATICKNWAEK